jgi:hypothetical protein
LHATIVSPNGGPVNEGTVTFSLAGVQTTVPVSNGIADVALNLPAGLAAGNYTLAASFVDNANANHAFNLGTASGTGTLSITPASTQTAVSSATITAGGGSQALTLNATVTSPRGPVNEGTVTITVAGQAVTAAVHGGVAVGVLSLPGGMAAGHYTVMASYNDATNTRGAVNLTPSAASGTLTVLQTTAVVITQVSLTPSPGGVTEVVTAQVRSPSGPVGGGMITFNIGGTQVQAAINNGTATAAALLVPGAIAGAQGVSANYSNSSALVGASTVSRTAFLNVFNAFFSGMVTLQPDGREVVTLDFFGIPLTFIYNASGLLASAFFGSFPLLV